MRESDFIDETCSPELFQIEDVKSDNSCFYRAIANGLRSMCSSDTDIDENTIINGKIFNNSYQNLNWGFDGEKQEEFARKLQQTAYEWVINNSKRTITYDESLELSIPELVNLTHGITLEEYTNIYKFFAGDLIVGKKNENIFLLRNRWGGYLEQIAISKHHKVPIIVLTLQSFNKKYNKVICGRIKNNKAYKNTRFRVFQISGSEYLGQRVPIFILWKKEKCGDHYLALYPKNREAISSILSNISE